MSSRIKPLLKYHDAFGWIPTIRGALSLDLIGNSKEIWGDVDRYAVDIINHGGLSSERFIAASAFQNVSDSKYGVVYTRTFRYFFYGSIHSKADGDAFIEKLPNEIVSCEDFKNVKDLIYNDGVLLGHLVIVPEETVNISNQEVHILNIIKDLISLRKDYNYTFSIKADSLGELAEKRLKMKAKWEIIRKGIDKLDSGNETKFSFDVFLTRDGIILLKDTSDENSRQFYFKSDTAEDYTQNIPIHRLFKTAMNFMKFLFHKNYHHEEQNDTFLPASNLHPYRATGNFSRIFKHQTDAFLIPLAKLRRRDFKHANVDPVGILCYTKSFTYACRNNGLITDDEAERQLDYISIQEQEINHRTRYSKSLLSSIASQNNLFFILTTILAFTVAVLKIFESGRNISGKTGSIFPDKSPWIYTALVIFGVCVAGYIFYVVSAYCASRREFKKSGFQRFKNRMKSWLFFADSNLKRARLSWRMQWYMQLQECRAELLEHFIQDPIARRRAIFVANAIIWVIMLGLIVWGIFGLL